MTLQPVLRKRGATFGLFLVLYGIGRFTIDFFRYYEENARVLMGLSFNQVISVGLIVIGVVLLLRRAAAPANA
jgi:prolipoprotein diacylglyceryltransferase